MAAISARRGDLIRRARQRPGYGLDLARLIAPGAAARLSVDGDDRASSPISLWPPASTRGGIAEILAHMLGRGGADMAGVIGAGPTIGLPKAASSSRATGGLRAQRWWSPRTQLHRCLRGSTSVSGPGQNVRPARARDVRRRAAASQAGICAISGLNCGRPWFATRATARLVASAPGLQTVSVEGDELPAARSSGGVTRAWPDAR